jgi:hypothetical protein
MKNITRILRDVAPFSRVVPRRFEETYCPHLQCQEVREVSNHEHIGGKHSETSVKFHPNARRHIQEDGKFRVMNFLAP